MGEKAQKHIISFIIPVLNGANYIGRCLDHIMADKESDDEIIVVDNGSTDKTMDIVRAYADVKLLQYPKVTIAGLRNRGADIAKGDLYAFIDSDCLVCRGWRDAVINAFNDDSIKAAGAITDIAEDSTWVERAWLSERSNNVMKINYINSANFIARREEFRKVGGFNEALITDEDYDIGARMTTAGFAILHDYRIRVIHLGNAKTLSKLFERKFWHSTSMLETARKNGLDKPLIMTFVFLLFGIAFLAFLPFSIHNLPVFIATVLGLCVVPVLTSLYRIVLYKNYRYFFELIILYFVFYLARVAALFYSPFRKKRK